MVPDRRASRRNLCAIAAARLDHGRWSGVSSMSVLSSRQRILSLWLPRLSTDRLVKWREVSLSLPACGEGGEQRSCEPGGAKVEDPHKSHPTRPLTSFAATLPL